MTHSKGNQEFEGIVAPVATTGWRRFARILAGVFVAMLPMMIFREFTPSNELRYLSIADEALRNGTWWAFTNHGAPYADKPPLYLWIIMIGKIIFGSHLMWFGSLFSIIPAFVTGLVMDRWASGILKDRYRDAALLMLFSCGLFAGMMFTLRMDMLMTMFIVLSLHQFRHLELSEGKPPMGARLLFATWIFLGVFTKGPMGILIPLLGTTVWLLLTKRIRLWSRAWGWPTWILLLTLCAIWFGLVYREGGSEYLNNLLVHQTVGRAVNSFHHNRPVWYYLIAMTYTLLPWTFLIFGSLVWGIRQWKKDLPEEVRYMLTIVFTTIVLLSAISSKLQVYMLPAFPFMIYIAAIACQRCKDKRLAKLGVAIPMSILAIAGLGVLALMLTVAGADRWWLAAGGTVLVVGTTLTFMALYAAPESKAIPFHNLEGGISVLALTVLAVVFVAGFAVRDFKADMGYEELAKSAVVAKENHPAAEIMTWRVSRPENMDIYLEGYPLNILSEDGESPDLPAYPVIVMTNVKDSKTFTNVVEERKVGRGYIVLVCDTVQK